MRATAEQIMQIAINSLGALYVNAIAAGSKVSGLLIIPMNAIGNSFGAYYAQNVGARKPERIQQGFRVGVMLTVIFSVFIFLISLFFSSQLTALFLRDVSREMLALMREMELEPKDARRKGNSVIYFKQSDRISDVLTYLGAPVAAMGIMEAKLEKELNNKVNRRCNCDDANTSKVVEAAQEQLVAIRILRDRGLMESLPRKLQQAAEARERNPESSLTELAAMMEPPITKPAMNHRLKKLVEMGKETAK